MTVMVTGASGPVGHALVPLLARRDEVRAAIRDPAAAEPLRALGAKVTLGRLDETDDLAEVLNGVFTLVGQDSGLPRQHIGALAQDTQGGLWVSILNDGLYEGRDGRFSRLLQPFRGVAGIRGHAQYHCREKGADYFLYGNEHLYTSATK